MLQRDGHPKGRPRGLRIGQAATAGYRLRWLQLRRRLERCLFEDDRAMPYLHLARDVQIVPGI